MFINGKEIKTTNDALAKFIFTTEGSEDICKNFTNAVLDDLNFKPIPDFSLTSPVFSSTTYDAKTNLFDVKGETSTNDQLDFEIQRTNHEGFEIRLINNNSRQFERVKQSTEYGNYPYFYVIAIVNFNFKLSGNVPFFHNCFCYSSIVVKESCLSYKAQIHVLEIPKWERIHKEPITIDSLKNYSQLDFFMKLFSDKTTYEEIQIMAAQNVAINYAKNKVDQFVLNDENLKAYSLAEEAEKVRRAEISYAVKEAVREAVKEARNEKECEIVRNMLNDNLPFETISKYTGLSSERITEIQSTL